MIMFFRLSCSNLYRQNKRKVKTIAEPRFSVKNILTANTCPSFFGNYRRNSSREAQGIEPVGAAPTLRTIKQEEAPVRSLFF
jgi:hypothetical protein